MKCRLRRRRTFDEQTHSLVACHRREGQGFLGIRRGERRQWIKRFAGHAQTLAARRENVHVRASLQQLLHQLSARRRQMLAVVENEQQASILHELDQRFGYRTPGLFLDTEDGRHRLRHQPRIGDRRQLDEPDTIGKFVHHVGSDLQRQPRLPETADTVQRHKTRLTQQVLDFRELAFAPDE